MILRLLSQIPAWVIRASLEASLIALLVFVAQLLLRDRISARWRYNLWLLVVARLLLPVVPESRVSPFNWMQTRSAARSVEQMLVARTPVPLKPIPMPTVQPVKPSNKRTPIQIAESDRRTIEDARYIDVLPEIDDANDAVSTREPGRDAESTTIAHVVFPEDELLAAPRRGKPAADSTGESVHSASGATPVQRVTFPQWIRTHWRTIGLIAWASVALLLLLRAIFTSVRISLIARRLKPIEDAWVVQLLDSCCNHAQISRAPTLVQSPKDIGPALVGIWNPRLLMPARVLETLNRNELRLVILHELVHLRRRDVAMNWVLAMLGALHWFNPVLWWAFARLRADRELACDEAVLQISRRKGTASDARDYGRAMLKLLEAFSGGASSPAAVGVLDGHPRWRNALMRRRITMIARFDKPKGWSLIGMSVSLLIGAIALTGAVRGQAALPDAQNAGATGPAPKPGTTSGATSAAGMPAGARPGMMGAGGAQNQPAIGAGMPGLPGAAAPSAGGPAMGRIQGAPSDLGGGIGIAPPGAGPAGSANPFGGAPAAGIGAPPLGGGAMPTEDSRFGHVEGPDAARADARTSENLRKPLKVAFNDVALADMTSYLADQTGADVFIDNKAMEEIGIDRNTPINLTLRQPLPAEEVLRLALRSAGGDTIGYGVFHGVVTITSRLQLERSQITRAYSIPDFDGRGDELINAINRTIAPETWDTHGGPSSILILGKRMIVTTAEPRHREIGRLLALLREGEPGPKAEAAQPQTPGASAPTTPTDFDPVFRALNHDLQISELRERVHVAQAEADALAERGNAVAAAKARVRYEAYRRELEDVESHRIHATVDALRGEITNWKSQLQDLQRQYGPEDPRVVEAQYRIAVTEQYIKRWTERAGAAGTSGPEEVQVHGVSVPATMADTIQKLWDQYQAKVYFINGKPQNQAQIDAEFKEKASHLKTVALALQKDQFDLQEAMNKRKMLIRELDLLRASGNQNDPQNRNGNFAAALQNHQDQINQVEAQIRDLQLHIADGSTKAMGELDLMRGAAANPVNPAPQTGGTAPKEQSELQSLRDVAKEFEHLHENLEDRGDAPAADLARKSLDDTKLKIAKLEEELRNDPAAGAGSNGKSSDLQTLRNAAAELETLANDLKDRGDTRAAQLVQRSVDEYGKKYGVLDKGPVEDHVESLHQQIANAERDYELMLHRKYTPNHPIAIQTKEQLDGLKAKLAQIEPWAVVGGVRVPADMAVDAQRTLKEQFEPKIYHIGGVEQNRNEVNQEFLKIMSQKVEDHISELLKERDLVPNVPGR